MKNLSQKTNHIVLDVSKNCSEAWSKIAPTWPLENIIACNPLQGFENLKFEKALQEGSKLFIQNQDCWQIEKINQISIKWCQAFFDQGQATIKMPNRAAGFYAAWKDLAIYDEVLHQGKSHNIALIKNLPQDSEAAISMILQHLKISSQQQVKFLTLLLTTLAGWSSYVKYLSDWSYAKDPKIAYDYLAIRLIITAIIWPQAAQEMIEILEKGFNQKIYQKRIAQIVANENHYRPLFLSALKRNKYWMNLPSRQAKTQMVFCIDVRSEPMRRALELSGDYETFGFAGFFGIPTQITSELTGQSYASCPVLLEPKHNVVQKSACSSYSKAKQVKGYQTILEFKKFYQSLKYNFTTPLPLAEAIGIASALTMAGRTFFVRKEKNLRHQMHKILGQKHLDLPDILTIPFQDQCSYAQGILKAIGLTENFAETVIFCGHGSQTENNSFATSLDCGACGGRHGDANAKILAQILNQKNVRKYLADNGIEIPQNTKFLAAKHNTTTDEIEVYANCDISEKKIAKLKADFAKAQKVNNYERAKKMGFAGNEKDVGDFFFERSQSWSEVQPEWGLAGNASFIVAPRKLTKGLNLGGRSFLHSYDWQIDEDNSILNLILNAPMVVAQWINSQYLFSTIDNVSFGSGSKITQNLVGKIGVMQGNGSDLMNGLSLQSVYSDDHNPYHQPMRLTTLVYAPFEKIDAVIAKSPKLQQLFANEWVMIYCFDPRSSKIYRLQRDLIWNEEVL